jgi:hypothetical protein
MSGPAPKGSVTSAKKSSATQYTTNALTKECRM